MSEIELHKTVRSHPLPFLRKIHPPNPIQQQEIRISSQSYLHLNNYEQKLDSPRRAVYQKY